VPACLGRVDACGRLLCHHDVVQLDEQPVTHRAGA
jgi:hypothetical protein